MLEMTFKDGGLLASVGFGYVLRVPHNTYKIGIYSLILVFYAKNLPIGTMGPTFPTYRDENNGFLGLNLSRI